MTAYFVADSFRKSFGSKSVLKAATAWAQRGEVSLLLGRNGSGKTTLIKCALGLYGAEQGIVRIDGETFLKPRLSRLAAHGLFYLPDRDLLSRRMTVRAQLALMSSRFRPSDPVGVADVAQRLGIGALLDHFPDQLSGGERRRAELALAVSRRPTCLIADEPLSEIEPKDRDLVSEMLRYLAREGAAVLVTGHDVHDLLDLADEVIWMTAGTTHGLGTPAEAKVHDQFRREYLGPSFS